MLAVPSLKLALVITNGDWATMIDALPGDGYEGSVKTCPQDALTLLADVNPDVTVLGPAYGEGGQRDESV